MNTLPTTHSTTKFTIAFALIFALAIVNIFLSMRSIHIGASLSSLEHQKTALQSEKTLIQQKLSQKNALHVIADTAATQGYMPISHTVTVRIPSDTSVALR